MPKRGTLLKTSDADLRKRLDEIDFEMGTMPKYTNEESRQIIQPRRWALSCERRRVKIALASKDGYLTLTEQIRFINDRGGVCEICGDNSNPSIDHIIPISKGGSNNIKNLRVLCGRFNSSKGDRIDG